VTTPDPLPQEALDALDALRMQVAFRLEAVALTRQLRHQALHDALTGLPNRMHLDVELSRRVAAEPERTHVLLLDLDGFKPVNDEHGHAGGDELLRVVGRRLVACVGARGFVARLGGDEFVVVVQGLAADADSAAAEIVTAVARPVHLPAATVTVGTSVGVAHGTPNAEVGVLLKEADVAMYVAKAAGRGRVAVAP
jgi:diguanylate cyclase (GGDEF)-like protein